MQLTIIITHKSQSQSTNYLLDDWLEVLTVLFVRRLFDHEQDRLQRGAHAVRPEQFRHHRRHHMLIPQFLRQMMQLSHNLSAIKFLGDAKRTQMFKLAAGNSNGRHSLLLPNR